MSILTTLIANLEHGVRNREPALIGGGVFSVVEQLQILEELRTREDLLHLCFTNLDDVDDPDLRHYALITRLGEALQ